MDMNTVDVGKMFGDVRDMADAVSAGLDAGANIASYIQDIIDPESRRARANPAYGNPYAYGQPPQQQPTRPSYGYGYAVPGSGNYNTGSMTYEGISNPNYGKGGGVYR